MVPVKIKNNPKISKLKILYTFCEFFVIFEAKPWHSHVLNKSISLSL